MILDAFGASLPMSIGVALSPLPIAGVMIILMTKRARSNAPAFLFGWILGILVVGVFVLLIPGIATTDGAPSAVSGMMRLAAGVVLLILSLRQWRRRPRPGQPGGIPKSVASLDDIGAIPAMGAGYLLSGVNPKNLLLTAAGAVRISDAAHDLWSQFMSLLLFATVACVTVAVPVAFYFLARRTVDAVFGRWKTWLIRNNAAVLTVLMLVFGLLLIGRGLRILAG